MICFQLDFWFIGWNDNDPCKAFCFITLFIECLWEHYGNKRVTIFVINVNLFFIYAHAQLFTFYTLQSLSFKNSVTGFLNMTLQILMNKLPFLTKGPFAIYFGGDAIMEELSSEKPGQYFKYLYLCSVIFNISILGKYKTIWIGCCRSRFKILVYGLWFTV